MPSTGNHAGARASSSSLSSSSPATTNTRRSSISRAVKKGTPPNGSNNKNISSKNTTKENPSSADKNSTGNGDTMGLRSARKNTPSSSSSTSSPPLVKESSSSPHVTGTTTAKDHTPSTSSSNSGDKGTGSSSKKKTLSYTAGDGKVFVQSNGDSSSSRRDTSSSSTSRKTRSADSVADTTTLPEDHDTLLSRRPKRKAASSVRFGSYKDMENNVDYTLLLDSFASSTSATRAPASSYHKSASTRANAKTSSSNGSKRKSSKSSPATSSFSSTKMPAKKQHQGSLRMTRSNLMTSKKTPGTVSTARNQEQRPISLNNVSTSQQQGARLNLTNLLPPILIERCSGKFTASMLRSLSKDARVEIFNRKTGRIMRGDEAIPIKGLVQALQEHAEYEPILPCPKRAKQQEHTYRESRTSPNSRVSSVVHPQTTMVRTSAIEGRHVLVTGGTQKGLIGKVHACIPGGWYMITDASNPDEFEYLIHSKNLRMINKNRPTASVGVNDAKGVDINCTEGLKIAAPLQQKRLDNYSSRTSNGKDILKLRNKIKELENKQQLNMRIKPLERTNKWGNCENGGNDVVGVEKGNDSKKKALDVISKALEETKSELQTKIFLGEILASSQL